MRGATEVLIQEKLLNVMAEDLAAKVISSSLREVAEIALKEEVVSVFAHEVGEVKKKNSAAKWVPDFAIESQSVRGATEVLVREELLNVTAEDLAAEVITSSLRELESASLVEDIASEAEKTIPGVTCELTDSVIEFESEDPEMHESVKETLSDVPSEDDKLSKKANECTLEWETVSAVQPEIAVEFENVTAVTEIHLQEEVVSVVAHKVGEAKRENSAVKLVPDSATELESVRGATEVLIQDELLNVMAEDLAAKVISSSLREVAEIALKEEVVSVFAHEVGEVKEKNSAVKWVPDFAIESESVRGATEVLVREELLNVTAEDLAAEVITSSLRELESASLVKDIASEAEKPIRGVTCELTDSVIEFESEDPEMHESVRETLSDVSSEDDKLSKKANECKLEWETVSAVQPEIAVEFENVTAVTEIHLQEEVVSVVAHKVGEAKRENSAVKLVPDFAIELESVRGATEVLIQEELINVIAEDLAAEVITSSIRELESVTLVEDIASEAETIQAVVCELTDSVIELESEDPVVDEVSETSVDQVLVDVEKLSGTVESSECMSEWETVGVIEPEVDVKFEGVAEVTDILVKEKIISSVVHELSAAEVKPDFSFKPQSVKAPIDVPLKQGNSTGITGESILTKSESAREVFPECSLLTENGSDISMITNEAADAEVNSSCTFWPENSLDLKSVSELNLL